MHEKARNTIFTQIFNVTVIPSTLILTIASTHTSYSSTYMTDSIDRVIVLKLIIIVFKRIVVLKL